MDITKIKETDIPTLAALYVDVFTKPPWHENWRLGWAIDRLDVIYRTPGAYGVFAQQAGKALGAIIGRAIPFQGALEFEIIEFFVARDYQQKGIGKILFSNLQTYLQERAYRKCTLLTGRQTPAKTFYADQGFDAHDNLTFMSHSLNRGTEEACFTLT